MSRSSIDSTITLRPPSDIFKTTSLSTPGYRLEDERWRGKLPDSPDQYNGANMPSGWHISSDQIFAYLLRHPGRGSKH